MVDQPATGGLPRVGICIVTYNSEDVILNCLRSLQAGPSATAIVVVDNRSHDRTVERVRAAFPDVAVIESQRNTGYAVGNNVGAAFLLERYSIDYVAFVNPDVCVFPETFSEMIQAIVLNPAAACAGGVFLVNGSPSPWCFRNRPTVLQKLIISGVLRHLPLLKTLIRPILTATRKQFFLPMAEWRSGAPVHAVSGACMLVAAGAFRKVGGFDPGTFLYAEESILAERLRKAGYEVVAAPQAIFDHIGGHSTSQLRLRAAWTAAVSEQILIRKYYRWSHLTCAAVFAFRVAELVIYGAFAAGQQLVRSAVSRMGLR